MENHTAYINSAEVVSTKPEQGVDPRFTENFRRAFAVVGVLVAQGVIPVNFDEEWHIKFESAVMHVANALNITAQG